MEQEIQKMCKRHNSDIWVVILAITLILIGLAGIIYSGVMQMILCYQKFGVIISSEHFFIPHLSLLGNLGIIPLAIGWIVIQ